MQIAIFGDIMIQGLLAECVAGSGGEELSARLRELIAPAEVAVANFETFVCPEGVSPANEWFSPPEAAAIVGAAGFDAVSVATNHTWDHGRQSVEHTLGLLSSRGVQPFGLGDGQGNGPQPLILERCGVRIGLLGYASASTVTRRPVYTAVVPSRRRLAQDVAALRPTCDVLIVCIHHGDQAYPSPEHRQWAQAAAEAGADAVVAHHSHEVAGWETIGGTVVAYGLGNVAASFSQEFRRVGMCLRLDVDGKKVSGFKAELFRIDDRGVPLAGTEPDLAEYRRHVDQINQALVRTDYDDFYWARFAAERRGKYLTSWRRDLRMYGVGTILAKLRRLRLHQIKVLLHILCRRGTSRRPGKCSSDKAAS